MKKISATFLCLAFALLVKAQCWQSIITGNAANHSMAVKADGSLYGWGENVNWQVGDNTNQDREMPTPIGTVTDWKIIVANGTHTMGIRSNGELWGWGHNANGELGDGTFDYKPVPTRIGTANNWDTLSAGVGFTHAIKTDGTLWAWGYSGYNQLGVWAGLYVNTPTLVNSSTNWKSVSGGVFSAVALKTDGTIWQWGNGYYIGAPSGVPVQIGTDSDWKMVVHGAEHTLALKNNGTLWAWGNNLTGQLGDGTSGGVHTGLPKQIGTDEDWLMVSAGGAASFAIKTDGSLWGWGNNSYGQQGDGSNLDKTVPTRIGTATDWKTVAAGAYHTLALKNDGSLWSAGLNTRGQLGLGNRVNTNIFTIVDCGTLPLTWISFTGRKEDNTIVLQWKTAAEQNTSHFEVERGNAPGQFMKIGSLKAAGHSREERSYSFTDAGPIAGANFYRIKQVDADGKFTYSETRRLTFGISAESTLQTYPNPAKTNLTITIPGELSNNNIRLIITNASARVVHQVKLSAGDNRSTLNLDIAFLPPGIYQLILATAEKKFSTSFVKY